MIKIGDSLICKKDYITDSQKYYTGNSYKISSGGIEDNEFYIKGEIHNHVGGGCWFQISDELPYRIRTKGSLLLGDFFMSLAEWREQQINSILDDN